MQETTMIDISWPITNQSTTYKNKNKISITKINSFHIDGVRESQININAHTGTHIDAPSHFVQSGVSIDKLSLNSVVGPCHVIDFTEKTDCITDLDLKHHTITTNDIILLKTKNSSLHPEDPFDNDFIYLHKSGAQYLAHKKIKSVGIDYLGIERSQPEHDTHKILLSNNIPIIEGLRLAHVEAGTYTLYCLPLNILNVEGAPARAILIKE